MSGILLRVGIFSVFSLAGTLAFGFCVKEKLQKLPVDEMLDDSVGMTRRPRAHQEVGSLRFDLSQPDQYERSLEGLDQAIGVCASRNIPAGKKGDIYSIAIEPLVRQRFRELNKQFAADKPSIHGTISKNGDFVARDPKIREDMQRNPLKYRSVPFKKLNGAPITEDEFVAIDVLTRTILGEMGTERCQPIDPYMTAVGRVIYNRAANVRLSVASEKRFCRGSCSGDDAFSERVKGVCVANKQFSLWNRISQTPRKERPNHHTLQERVFCPGENASRQMWENAARVAMLVVLNPNKLRRFTPGLDSNYYTSAVSWPYGTEDADPTVKGVQLTNNSCLRFWTER